jgi:hypothetical protein
MSRFAHSTILSITTTTTPTAGVALIPQGGCKRDAPIATRWSEVATQIASRCEPARNQTEDTMASDRPISFRLPTVTTTNTVRQLVDDHWIEVDDE